MKITMYCSVFVLAAAMAFPLTAEAFSRRPQSSEVFQTQQGGSKPTQGETPRRINAVPEPPSFLLLAAAAMGIGVIFMMRRFHK
jgi:hypothetical protein